jgi:hypothetical protein
LATGEHVTRPHPGSAEPNGRVLEPPSPPVTVAESTTGHRAGQPSTSPALHNSAYGDLVAIVTEHDCSRTLATGLGQGESAVAIAGVHQRRDDGLHIAIDPEQATVFAGDGVSRLRAGGLLSRVQVIDTAPELALPDLLRRGTELDFALIQGPKMFEDAFVEFLYLDRMLISGGFIAVSGTGENEVAALLEFAAQARYYEPCSAPGSALPVLRKLGHQRARETPFPFQWLQPSGRRPPYPEAALRGFDTTPSRRPDPSPAQGAALRSASTRELYLATARAAELESRLYALGARLVDAELQAAREMSELHGELSELHGELELANAAHQRAEHWLEGIKSSASWRLTAPLRWLTRLMRALLSR